jgi:hypothetical protein
MNKISSLQSLATLEKGRNDFIYSLATSFHKRGVKIYRSLATSAQ